MDDRSSPDSPSTDSAVAAGAALAPCASEPLPSPERGGVVIAPSSAAASVAVAALAAAGVTVRLVAYLRDRSLWADEAQLALNLIERPWHELLGPLDFNQGAPPGFLVTEKLAVTVLGPSEQALRLFPFLCGIGAIVLFIRVARSFVRPHAVPVAVALFVAADSLIYYSSELKPYSTDVAATLIVLLLGRALGSDSLPRRRGLWIGAALAVVIWFSYAAAFAVTGVAAALLARAVGRRDWRGLRRIAVPIGVAAVNLTGALVVAHNALTHLQASFQGEGAASPFPPASASAQATNFYPTGLSWLRLTAINLGEMLGYSGARPASYVMYLGGAAGIVGFFSLIGRSRLATALLILPLLCALGASLLHEYPLHGRTMLFVLPIVALLVGEGAAAVADALPGRRTLVLSCVAVLVCGIPGALAAERAVAVPEKEDVKPALHHLLEHWRATDALYVHYAAQYAFAYYAECNCLDQPIAESPRQVWSIGLTRGTAQFAPALRSDPPRLIIGRPSGHALPETVHQLAPLRGRGRVWVLVSHVGTPDERAFVQRRLLGYLSCVGRRIEAFGPEDAAVYLYDLGRWSERATTVACNRRYGISS